MCMDSKGLWGVVVEIRGILSSQFVTLPEANMVPENRVSQNETSIPTIHLQVLLLMVQKSC